MSTTKPRVEWVLDSGCSFHVCPIEGWFMRLREFDGGKVFLGNNFEYKVRGVDDMILD